jgi:glycosyltransferase involved in cell wall biosynthesis
MKRTCLFHVSGNVFPPLSVAHHTQGIWRELAKGFDEYHVIARGSGNRYSHSQQGTLHLHLLPRLGRSMLSFLLTSWALPFLALRYRPTHLLAQCPVVGGGAAALCSRVLGIPLMVEIHGEHYFNSRSRGRASFFAYRLLSPFAFAAARRIRTLSPSMEDELERVYGPAARAKAVTVPNRVDLGVFSSAKEDYAVGEALRVVSVGSFLPVKNHAALIRGLAASGVPFRLTLVGGGALEAEYLRVAEELGCADRVAIRRNLSHAELAGLLVAHDVYVHYSLSEAVPRALLEAMAVGLPVAATPVGFVDGVVEHGRNGLLVTPATLGPALDELFRDEGLRRRLGTAARRTIAERFEGGAVFERYRQSLLGMSDAALPAGAGADAERDPWRGPAETGG